jgi:hypothetical protein
MGHSRTIHWSGRGTQPTLLSTLAGACAAAAIAATQIDGDRKKRKLGSFKNQTKIVLNM